MNIIDRYLLRQFLQNFVICFMSLMGVYVVFDAFTNLEAFMSLAKGLTLMKVIAAYYGYQSLFFFDRISALLVLMSAMFTMAWIQRHHEMTALMAAGISRIRVVAPVLAAAVAIIAAGGGQSRGRDPQVQGPACHAAFRPERQRGRGIAAAVRQCHRRADRRTVCGYRSEADRDARFRRAAVQAVVVQVRQSSGRRTLARYLPAKDGRPAGYLLIDVTEPKNLAQRPSLSLDGRPVLMTPHDHPDWLKPNEAFVVSDVTVDELTGGTVLRRFASTGELIWALKNHSIYFSPDVRVTIHSRILQPLLDITLLFLGLPLVAARDNRNVFLAIGMCMGLVALFFIVAIACQQLGSNCLISPVAGRLGAADDLRARRGRHVRGDVGTLDITQQRHLHACWRSFAAWPGR